MIGDKILVCLRDKLRLQDLLDCLALKISLPIIGSEISSKSMNYVDQIKFALFDLFIKSIRDY